MGLEQYEVGKSWEEEVMDYYMKNGYSTLKLSTDIDGTVFDVIAMKSNRAICIECKHTTTNKLYYKSSGLEHKRDELDNFSSNDNEIWIFIKSDKTGKFAITWQKAKPILKEKGFLTKEDCMEVVM